MSCVNEAKNNMLVITVDLSARQNREQYYKILYEERCVNVSPYSL